MIKKFQKIIIFPLIFSLIQCYSFESQRKMTYEKASLNFLAQTKNKKQTMEFKLGEKQVYDLNLLRKLDIERGFENEILKKEISFKLSGQSKFFEGNTLNYHSELQLLRQRGKQTVISSLNVNTSQKIRNGFLFRASYSVFDIEKNEIFSLKDNGKKYMNKTGLNLIYRNAHFSLEGFIAKENIIDYENDIGKEFKNTYGLIIKKKLFGFNLSGSYRYVKELKEHDFYMRVKKEF